MNVLETEKLSKQFGGLIALNTVDCRVGEGEIVGLIGPNGAGKSTFINAVSGLNPPSRGKVEFLGKEVTGFSPQKMCHLGLSRTFQIPQPFPKLTVLETVLVSVYFGRGGHYPKDVVGKAMGYLDFVGLDIDLDTKANQLNTVQLKRLDLARAIASAPKLLLLDELASGLSGSELQDLMDIIIKIKDLGVTILMVEHIMKVIMSLCDRLIVLQFGNKIAEGKTAEVAVNPKVEEAYLGADDD